MATAVIMPKVGISVESCVLTKWHKKKGDKVKKGDVLFTYETDKSTVDEESAADGVILDVFFKEGDDVPVMLNVCVIGKDGEDTGTFAPVKAAEEKPAEKKEEAAKAAAPAPVATPAQASGELKVSPRARVLAAKKGIDPSLAIPTGAEGRIVEKDIAALADKFTMAAGAGMIGAAGTGIGGRARVGDAMKSQKTAFAGPEFYEEKASNMRKVIAKAMHESLSSMAQLTLNASFDATAILDFRAMLKAKGKEAGLPNITLNDIVLFAVSRVLMRHKYVNANFLGDTYRFFNTANIGMAVDTEKGLIVPTLFGADRMSLAEIGAMAKELADKAQKGALLPDAIRGGSFTVTNLGIFGIESFTPVINPPQTAILGVCGLSEKVKTCDGQLKGYQSMGLSLTIDHRAIDGAPAARFLKDLCESLENFTLMLL